MRPVLAFLITVFMIGGVYGYINFSHSVRRPPIEIEIDFAEGEYSVQIERTFECVADPILGPESLKVMFKGDIVYANKEPIPNDELVIVRPLEQVELGENEIYVSANMPESANGFGVLKVVVKQNDRLIGEEMISSVPGLTSVGGPVVFTVKPHVNQTKHEH